MKYHSPRLQLVYNFKVCPIGMGCQMWTESVWRRVWTRDGACGGSNGYSFSADRWRFIEWMSHYWLLRKYTVSSSSCKFIKVHTNACNRSPYISGKQTNSVAFNPQANSTGEVTAKLYGWGSVAWSAQPILTAVNLSFLDWSHYLFFRVDLIYPHKTEWTLFQNQDLGSQVMLE
jgi:hypothetical protein